MLVRHRRFMSWATLYVTALLIMVAYSASAPITMSVILACITGNLLLSLQYALGANRKAPWIEQLPLEVKRRLFYSVIGITPVILVMFFSMFCFAYRCFGDTVNMVAEMTAETILLIANGLYILLCSVWLLNIFHNLYDILVSVIVIMLGSLVVGWLVAYALVAIRT